MTRIGHLGRNSPLRSACSLLAAGGLALTAGWSAAGEPTHIRLDVAGHAITAELAVTPTQRQRGLMHRDTLPDNHGMLFVYAEPEQICMWMKNTRIPLSVAFMDDQGKIINIAEMQPESLDIHCAARPARYALEMARGWFARRGLAPGMRIRGLKRLPSSP
ncbi:MAG: DUF192 domain-containing protein [Thiobacillaceae bacterium]